jgi:hypothetical protein
MKQKQRLGWSMGLLLASGVAVCFLVSCAATRTVETEYTPEGTVSYQKDKINDSVLSELRRVFINKVIEAEGIFENRNDETEGMARSAATKLAITELAGKVQTTIRQDDVIYNQKDVREVTETQIRAIVSNYNIDFAGYDPGTKTYRVRVSIKGEQLIREIESRITK